MQAIPYSIPYIIYRIHKVKYEQINLKKTIMQSSVDVQSSHCLNVCHSAYTLTDVGFLSRVMTYELSFYSMTQTDNWTRGTVLL